MTLPRAGVRAEIDLAQWSSAISEMIADATRVQDSLMGLTVSVEVDSDFGTVEDAISTIEAADPEITVGADVSEMMGDVETELSDIEASDPEVTVGGDPEPMVSSVDEAVLGFDDLDPEIPVTSDDKDIASDIAEIKESLNTVKKLAIVDFIFNIPANFNAFVDTMTNLPGIGFLVEADEMLSHIAAKTGELVPDLEDVINALRVESGDTQAIEDALTFLIQNGETSADALQSVSELGLDFVDIWGGDVVSTLATAQQMVKSGLVPTIEDAFNVMTLGMQSGANAQGDLLTFLEKNAANFVELGINGQEAIALASGAINAGVPDLQRYGQMFLGLRKDLASGGEETQQMLKDLKIDPDDIGIEGYTAILDYLSQIQDQTEQTTALTDTFGTRVQGLTAPQALAMPDPDVLAQDIDNLAADTGDTFEANITDSLSKAVDSFQVELVQALDDALNISGFIDKVTGAAVTFSSSIKEGMTIGQALEVSLALPEGSFASFESSVGNFAIGVLQLIAGVQDFLGKDSSGTRAAIARAGKTQLAFDLQIADEDEIAGVVATAIDRGVSQADIQSAIATSFAELDLAEAQTLLNQIMDLGAGLSDNAQNLIEKYGSAEAAVTAFGQASYEAYDSDIFSTFEEQVAAIEELEGIQFIDLIDTDALQAQIDTQVADLMAQYNEAIANSDLDLATEIGKKLNRSDLDTAKAVAGDQLAGFFDGLFATATGEYDPLTTEDLADITQIQTDFANTASNVQVANDAMINSAADLQRQIGSTVTVSVANVRTLNDEGSEEVAAFTQVWLALSGAITDTVTNLAGPLSDFAGQLGTFVELGTASVQLGSQIGAQGGVIAQPDEQAFASGTGLGGASGVFKVGEGGEEILSTDRQVGILNAQTTGAIISGLAAMLGGSTNHTVNNQRSIYAPVTINTQSSAQDAQAMYDINNKLRGF